MLPVAGFIGARLLGIDGARRARAQKELDRIFTLSSDLIAVADFNGYFTRVNPAAERILGYTEAELRARPYLDFVHPDDRETTAAETAAILQGEASGSFENRYVRKDGSLRVLEWQSTPIVEDGFAYAVGRDVTERRQAEAERERLAGEQAALRRVAMLLAGGTEPEAVFRAVAAEVEGLLGCDTAGLVRFEADGTAIMLGAHRTRRIPGERFELAPGYVLASVLETGRAARFDTEDPAAAGMPEPVRAEGIRSGLASPIVIDGALWGAITIASLDRSLPAGTEHRLDDFTELMATAIANTESRAEVERLAGEQAALRRVATLVAEGVQPAEVFAAVSEEVGRLFSSESATVGRFDPDGPAHVVVGLAKSTEGIEFGSRSELDDSMAVTAVYRTRRSARVDGVDSSVSSPIVVEGRLWGAISVAAEEPLPPHAEERLEKFTELVGTAIANAESREALARLAEEQAALRRVATLVAEGAPSSAVLDAVVGEMAALLDADQVALNRFEAGDEILVLAHRGLDVARTPVGSRVSTDGQSVTAMVRRTGRPARMENYDGAEGALAELARATGLWSSVSSPIIVEGRLWGLITASWKREQSPPPDTEQRMAKFAQLLDTAIANADSRDQLTASRARLVTEGDEARRRVVRDLHDGAQQRLVHAIVTLKLAQRALQQDDGEAEAVVAEALEQAQQANAELRELAHGLLPAVLTRGGLRAGLDTVVARIDLPVQVDVPAERFPREIEASAYFIVAEALTNVVKHAHAGSADVKASVHDGMLHLEVRDDGIGGADPRGHGLVGMSDRVSALGGRLEIESPAGGGTLVAAELPLPAGDAGRGGETGRA